MKPDPRIKSSADPAEQIEIEGGGKQHMHHPENRGKHSLRTLFGGLPRLCRGIQNMLPAYLDESLNAGKRQTVGRHLDVCAACRYELRLLARSEQALIGAASAVPMSGDLWAGFYARLAMTPRPADKRRGFVPALAVCGLLLFASTTAYRLHILSGGLADSNTPLLAETRSIATTHSAEAPHLSPRRDMSPVVGLPESLARNRSSRPASTLAYQGSKQNSILAAQRMPLVGGGPHRALASVIAGRRAELTQEQPGRHKEREPQRIASVSHSAFSPHVLTVSTLKRNFDTNARRPRNMQVALLTRDERNAAAPRTRSDVRLTRGESSPSTNSFSLQTDAIDANAVALAKGQHSGLAFSYGTSQQISASTMPSEAMGRESMADGHDAGAMGYAASETDGVSFQVKDAQRGFVSGTRAESRMQMRGGRQVLSLHLEDEDRPEPDTADRPVPPRPATQPAQNTKTGSEKER